MECKVKLVVSWPLLVTKEIGGQRGRVNEETCVVSCHRMCFQTSLPKQGI